MATRLKSCLVLVSLIFSVFCYPCLFSFEGGALYELLLLDLRNTICSVELSSCLFASFHAVSAVSHLSNNI